MGATVASTPNTVIVRCVGGIATFRSNNDAELHELTEVLAQLDGSRTWDTLSPTLTHPTSVEACLESLIELGAVLPDSSRAWSWLYKVAKNPPPFPPPATAEAAYALGRTESVLLNTTPDCVSRPYGQRLGGRNGSLDLNRIKESDSVWCGDTTLALLSEAQDSGQSLPQWPYSSAGGFYPIHLVALTPTPEGKYKGTEFIQPSRRFMTAPHEYSMSEVASMFIEDRSIQDSLHHAPSIVFFFADMLAITAKYGNRAWAFALIETGQLLCRLELLGNMDGMRTRPIGGFCEDRVTQLLELTPDTVPTLSLLLANEESL